MIRHKGLHYLIEAFGKVRTDKKLVISGEGSFTDSYEKELNQLAKNDSRVILTGRLDGSSVELAEMFSNAYVYAHPTESEGLSISLLETMSYGVPPLISDIPENLEAAGNAGFVFKSGDVADLARMLQYLIDNPAEVERKKILGKRRVEKHYDWEMITNNVVAVYRKAQAGRRFRLRRLSFFHK